MPCFGKTYCYISKRFTQSEFFDVFYCGHVTYQIWAWFETFEGDVNRTNTANFFAHWTSGTPQKGGFEIPLATDSTRLVVKRGRVPEQRTANVQWSRTLEVVKASQSHTFYTLPVDVTRDLKQRQRGRRRERHKVREHPKGPLRMTGGKRVKVLHSVTT